MLSHLAFLNPAKHNSQCGANNRGLPQSRQDMESAQDRAISLSKSYCSSFGMGQCELPFPVQNDMAHVPHLYGPKPSLLKTGDKLDDQPRQDVGANLEAKALPLDWLLGPKTRITLHERIMARLIQSEAHEQNPWLRSDYRQAWICVSLAAKGNTEPFLVSSYQIYGTHPDKVWKKVMRNRESKLQKEFSQWYDAAGNLKPDIPKKPQVTQDTPNERIAALLNYGIPSETGSDGRGGTSSKAHPPSPLSVPGQAHKPSLDERQVSCSQTTRELTAGLRRDVIPSKPFAPDQGVPSPKPSPVSVSGEKRKETA